MRLIIVLSHTFLKVSHLVFYLEMSPSVPFQCNDITIWVNPRVQTSFWGTPDASPPLLVCFHFLFWLIPKRQVVWHDRDSLLCLSFFVHQVFLFFFCLGNHFTCILLRVAGPRAKTHKMRKLVMHCLFLVSEDRVKEKGRRNPQPSHARDSLSRGFHRARFEFSTNSSSEYLVWHQLLKTFPLFPVFVTVKHWATSTSDESPLN